MSDGLLSTHPTSLSPEACGFPGAPMAISANGSTSRILWAVQPPITAPNDSTALGALHAYDAAKTLIPTEANGTVLVTGQTQLVALGLLP